jgi:hypothetical protein
MSDPVGERGPRLIVDNWRRRTHAPYTIVMQSVSTSRVDESQQTPSVEAAILAVVNTPGFPMKDSRVAVMDVDGWMVFGYSTDPAFMKDYGHPAWFGCELGFAILESTNRFDPLNLAVMEAVARDASDDDRWWRHAED